MNAFFRQLLELPVWAKILIVVSVPALVAGLLLLAIEQPAYDYGFGQRTSIVVIASSLSLLVSLRIFKRPQH